MSSYWRDNISYCLSQRVVRSVSIKEMPHKGNYYVLPWVTLGGMFVLSLPVKIMRISETSDEALLEAAVYMIDYYRLPTLGHAAVVSLCCVYISLLYLLIK